MIYIKNQSIRVSGFIVPKEFIIGHSLSQIERILGLRNGFLQKGAVFARLHTLPEMHELDYFGDTRAGEHNYEEKKNKHISQDQLNASSYHYLTPKSELIKVISFSNPNPLLSVQENWPAGQGAMQWRLKKGISKSAIVLAVVEKYPNGIFK